MHYFADVPTLNVERFGSLTGKGVEGTVDGVHYFAGSRRLLDEQGIVVGKELNIEAQRLSAEAKSIVWFADSEQALAVAAIADRIKDSSVEAVRELQAAGIDVYMLTATAGLRPVISRKRQVSGISRPKYFRRTRPRSSSVCKPSVIRWRWRATASTTVQRWHRPT